MLSAFPWYIATDNDPAGDKAADGWPSVARRIRPPGPHKDWTEAHKGGVDLRRFWEDVLAGNERPPPGTLGWLLHELGARGIRIDGELTYPRIGIGTVTGRITYSAPGLQSLPKVERLARLAPVVEGRRFVRADYGQIEPRILLAILQRRGSITWEAGEDLYLTLAGDTANRDTAKTVVNRIINGGRSPAEMPPRLSEFSAAADAYRAELARKARTQGVVHTLAGHVIELAANEDNHAGKAVNRVVQGTAADMFNRAAVRVSVALEASSLAAAVAFLLFDELWVEADPADIPQVVALVRAEMEAAAAIDGVVVPVRLDPPLSSDEG
jgi:DNA polymerase-1